MASIDLSVLLPIIRSEFPKLRIPSTRDKVYKDECVLSFDSPFSDTGLYVNLVTWQGFGQEYFLLDAAGTNSKLYLHEKWTQVPIETPTPSESAPTKLAIGVEGGFITEAQFELVKEHTLIVITATGHSTIPLPADIPEFVNNVIQAIIAHDGMKSQMQLSSWDADQEKIVSKYAEGLEQVDNGKKNSNDPTSWRCEASGDTNNLWLNLSTGYIGGGRRNWDGSGGSNGAYDYFLSTGKMYPLCVKLGTVTPHGADVWSYADDEDCLVIDPLLSQHLSHWGIDIMKLEKTDRTLGEMEVELNMTYDWSKILESGEELTALRGPGYVGLRNIGSSCYMNAVLQIVLAVPECQERYLGRRSSIISSHPANPAEDFVCQFSKVAEALLSAKYTEPLSESAVDSTILMQEGEDKKPLLTLEKYVVAPRMLKQLVGKNHEEFSSGKQQDASEYFMHLLDFMNRAERTALPRILAGTAIRNVPTSNIFEFHIQTKFRCLATNQVKYIKLGQQTFFTTFDLRIPLDKAVNISEVCESQEKKKARTESSSSSSSDNVKSEEEDVKLLIPFEACLETFFAQESIEFTNPSLGQPGSAMKTLSFRTFPRYLMVKLGRYNIGESGKQEKIDARVSVPEKLDLSSYRGHGPQEGEVLMPESPPAATTSEIVPDELLVSQLVTMGFSENACRRAAIATNNADAETAMSWVFTHMEDPDFNDPPQSTAVATKAEDAPDAEALAMLTSMGFTIEQVTAALKETNNSPERAADWLFSRGDNIDAEVAQILSSSTSSNSTDVGGESSNEVDADDGEGKYTLMAIISHMGTSTDHGHYVCHILKDGKWAIFNDEKVAQSKVPPLEYGFMYLYKRDDGPGTMAI